MRRPEGVRFAFLCDAHLTRTICGPQRRLLDWCRKQIKERMADRIVLGGDLTHHADPAEVEELLGEVLVSPLPIDYLPGNNEGRQFEIDGSRHPGVRLIAGCQSGGEGWPPRTYLLATTDAQDVAAAVGQLIAQWPQGGHVLILAHFPPEMAGDGMEKLAARHGDQQIWWICGHKHVGRQIDSNNLHVVICGGLDPVKVRGQLPELLMIDWDGREPIIEHLHPPEALLHPARFQPHPIGLAYRGSAGDMVQTALEHGIACLQFHYSLSRGEPTEGDRAAAGEFRRRFGQGFLSLHLPNFVDDPAGPTSPDLEACLQWAAAMKLDDLTIHLPPVRVERVFDQGRRWVETPWTDACRQVYLALAERALAMGAQLSLENVYNKEPGPPENEKLSSRPWHLIQFVQWLRSALSQKGYAADQVERIGIIFDTGHAFRDATVAKIHGLADWIGQVGPWLQLAHIHQVGISPEGKPTNHRPITDRLGPMINYAGVMAAIEENGRRPVPLLIEVRDRGEALMSWRTLWGAETGSGF
jgi:predicted MPP superfamily phosphohydrolase/sugar phosphate isomerase/epimerase